MKIKYIIQWFYTPRDISGNVYSYVIITDTRTGRSIKSSDVPESNARLVAFYLNGKNHVNNYHFVTTELTKRQFKYYSPLYLSCDPEVLAAAMLKEIRRRKPISE